MPKFSLFDDFPKISTAEWTQKIEADLNGLDYASTLVWQSQEGISVQPFYTNENSVAHEIRKKEEGWLIGQIIEVADAEKANSRAVMAVEKGAKSLRFVILTEVLDFNILLRSIDLKNITVHFDFRYVTDKNRHLILEFSRAVHDVYMHFDCVSHLVKRGNWFVNQKADFDLLKNLLSTGTNKVISVDATVYQNAGATITQQLAYVLAHANEYLNQFDTATINIQFKVAVGSNYFFEIAKLRALRLLWATLASEYGINEECFISATPSRRNKTLYDYNVNMLRTTTECMSAVIGGADIIYNQAYDVVYHEPNEFGDRIAINQLLILKSESYFDKIENAAEGTYYIESLTQELAENALVLFKKIEASGGFLEQLKKSVIQDEIKASATLEQEKFDNNELILIGTNKYSNASDTMKDVVNVGPFSNIDFGETEVVPIVEKRLAEKIEHKRLNDE
ncbi:methylmalonyl-CoA mutase subunit beta [Aurantibacter crassamenti]|uniref:methylmalonyl-CoA mutase subunit beta n=1 Tax=Aurantibacter crassamenti TaxID=1837375 RepID=UPI001939E0F6|nr:methylmalonyl-CoA mutase subunit beta [Aurantibacter crassamenti]MBM1105585.1 methylmalonyl-CoA mutase subunit beta [Aurantibacter crassamenti]